MSEGATIGLYVSPGLGLPQALRGYIVARPSATVLACLQHDATATLAIAATGRRFRAFAAAPGLVESCHALVAWWEPQDVAGRSLLATAWNTWLSIRLFSGGVERTFQRIEVG